jgi:hypothetical protein
MKQHRHLSLSRVATALLLTIVLSYRCSADESSNLRRAAKMTGNNDDHDHVHVAAAASSPLGMHSRKYNEEGQFFLTSSSSAAAERRTLVSCRDCLFLILLKILY